MLMDLCRKWSARRCGERMFDSHALDSVTHWEIVDVRAACQANVAGNRQTPVVEIILEYGRERYAVDSTAQETTEAGRLFSALSIYLYHQ